MFDYCYYRKYKYCIIYIEVAVDKKKYTEWKGWCIKWRDWWYDKCIEWRDWSIKAREWCLTKCRECYSTLRDWGVSKYREWFQYDNRNTTSIDNNNINDDINNENMSSFIDYNDISTTMIDNNNDNNEDNNAQETIATIMKQNVHVYEDNDIIKSLKHRLIDRILT